MFVGIVSRSGAEIGSDRSNRTRPGRQDLRENRETEVTSRGFREKPQGWRLLGRGRPRPRGRRASARRATSRATPGRGPRRRACPPRTVGPSGRSVPPGGERLPPREVRGWFDDSVRTPWRASCAPVGSTGCAAASPDLSRARDPRDRHVEEPPPRGGASVSAMLRSELRAPLFSSLGTEGSSWPATAPPPNGGGRLPAEWHVALVLRFASADDVPPYAVHRDHRELVDAFLRPRLAAIAGHNFVV